MLLRVRFKSAEVLFPKCIKMVPNKPYSIESFDPLFTEAWSIDANNFLDSTSCTGC